MGCAVALAVGLTVGLTAAVGCDWAQAARTIPTRQSPQALISLLMRVSRGGNGSDRQPLRIAINPHDSLPRFLSNPATATRRMGIKRLTESGD